MIILRDCELWYPKLDPKRPNKKYNKKNPTWEVQIRTTNVNQKKEWEKAGLSVKAVIPDDGSAPYYRAMLKKNSIKADNTPAKPVEVLRGDLSEADPASISHGSIGHVKLFQREYKDDEGKDRVMSILMGIQLKKHIVFTFVPQEGSQFEEEEYETYVPEQESDDVPY